MALPVAFAGRTSQSARRSRILSPSAILEARRHSKATTVQTLHAYSRETGLFHVSCRPHV